jgi:hypothetical protein
MICINAPGWLLSDHEHTGAADAVHSYLEQGERRQLILNFHNATNVTFAGIGIFGNVLAPRAFVDFSNGQLNGTLVANSWCGYGQINIDHPPPPPCRLRLPPCEPGTAEVRSAATTSASAATMRAGAAEV